MHGQYLVWAGRACVLYNDVLPTRPWPQGRVAVRTAVWRMRRTLFLSCLTRAVGPPDAKSSVGDVASAESTDGRHLAENTDGRHLVGSAPIALAASAEALRLSGAASDVEKNWVPWVHNGSLMLSYSVDPHIVLRVPQVKNGIDGTQ